MSRSIIVRRVLLCVSALVWAACSESRSASPLHAIGGGGGSAGKGDSAGTSGSGQAGASAAAGSGATGGSSGSAGTGGSGGGSAGVGYKLGDVIEFVPGRGEVPYQLGENPYGIRGGAFLARSPNGNQITVANEPGKICISGSLEEVPNGDYTGYWGVEIGFNLNQVPASGGGGEGGAAGAPAAGGQGGEGGADGNVGAGGAPDVADPWDPGQVLGFSFVIEGSKIGPVRFKSLPAGFDPTLEASVYCRPYLMAPSGVPQDSLFAQMMQYCWDSASMTPLPLASGLANISWQLPADVNTGVREFDWCVSDLRPLLAP